MKLRVYIPWIINVPREFHYVVVIVKAPVKKGYHLHSEKLKVKSKAAQVNADLLVNYDPSIKKNTTTVSVMAGKQDWPTQKYVNIGKVTLLCEHNSPGDSTRIADGPRPEVLSDLQLAFFDDDDVADHPGLTLKPNETIPVIPDDWAPSPPSRSSTHGVKKSPRISHKPPVYHNTGGFPGPQKKNNNFLSPYSNENNNRNKLNSPRAKFNDGASSFEYDKSEHIALMKTINIIAEKKNHNLKRPQPEHYGVGGPKMGDADLGNIFGTDVFRAFGVSMVGNVDATQLNIDNLDYRKRYKKYGPMKITQSQFAHSGGKVPKSGRKRALIVALNYDAPQYSRKSQGLTTPVQPEEPGYNRASSEAQRLGKYVLWGSRDDGRRWLKLLTEVYGFAHEDILLLTDHPESLKRRGRPNKEGIEKALKWLVNGAIAGDTLFFSFSGHGFNLLNKPGLVKYQEKQEYDKNHDGAIASFCTLAALDGEHLRQREVHNILFGPDDGICEGVKLTMIVDCCYSGAGFDLPYQLENTPCDRNTNRKLNWAKDRDIAYFTPSDTVLITASTDQTTANDFQKGALRGGALSLAFISALNSQDENHTWESLLRQIRKAIGKQNGGSMKQTPQLFSSQRFKLTRVFDIDGEISPNLNVMEGATPGALEAEELFLKTVMPKPELKSGDRPRTRSPPKGGRPEVQFRPSPSYLPGAPSFTPHVSIINEESEYSSDDIAYENEYENTGLLQFIHRQLREEMERYFIP